LVFAMSDNLGKLFYTVLGGVIITAFSYFFFPEKIQLPPQLSVSHDYVNMVYADDIFSSELVDRFLIAGSKKLFDGKNVNIWSDVVKKIENIDTFEGLVNVTVNQIDIFNNTNKRLSDIVFLNNFDFRAYLVNETSKDKFKVIDSKNSYKINYIDPGTHIYVTAFSKHPIYDLEKFSIIQGDTKLKVEKFYFDEEFLPFMSFFSNNPFLSFSIIGLGIISGVVFILSFGISLLLRYYPQTFVRLVSKAEYERMRKIVALYRSEERRLADE
jgi:hypothetical protein